MKSRGASLAEAIACNKNDVGIPGLRGRLITMGNIGVYDWNSARC